MKLLIFSFFFFFFFAQPNDFQLLQQLGMSEEDQLKLALELSIQGTCTMTTESSLFFHS